MTNLKQTLTLNIPYDLYDSQNDLPPDELSLVLESREALKHSYSPYSHFSVGAAILLEDGTVVKGSNQENAAYTPTSCAERSALYAIGSQGKHDQVRKIAVIARPTADLETTASIEQEQNGTPCGVCRQVIKEFEVLAKQKIVILCVFNTDRVYRFEGIDCLLPFGFGPNALS
jgi:cytidine deaminase